MLPLKNINKIGIFRALQLGDLLCSIPAIRALRRNFPKAKIVLIGLPWQQSLIKRFPDYFDEFIYFPGYPGLPEQEFNPVSFDEFAEKMRQENFDLLLQMQGNGTIVNEMLQQLNSKNLAGFYNDISIKPSHLFMKYPDTLPEVLRHIALMKHLKLEVENNEMEFPIFEEDIKNVAQLNLGLKKRNYIVVHPGSRGKWRQWPPKLFAKLTDKCIEKKYKVLITGTENEADITSKVLDCMMHNAVNLTGKTNLGMVAYLIKNARILISNCTGVAHISAATKTPSLVISMDGEPHRWAPLDKNIHKVIDWTKHGSFHYVDKIFEELISFKADMKTLYN